MLQDFLGVFHRHTEKHRHWFVTVKFYKARGEERDLYNKLGEAYDFHVDLVEDLMLELTRAANYICERIRQFIDPTFRLKEGVILVESGPTSTLSYNLFRPRYHGGERTLRPYPGLEDFKIARKKRDVHFGIGIQGLTPQPVLARLDEEDWFPVPGTAGGVHPVHVAVRELPW